MTIARMIPASTHSATLSETAAAKIRIRTRGLPNCLQSRRSGPRCCASSTLFGPTTASRSAARAAVSPFGPEPSDALTAPASRLQYGAVVSGALTRRHFPEVGQVGKQLRVDPLKLSMSSTVTRDDDGELSSSRQQPPPWRGTIRPSLLSQGDIMLILLIVVLILLFGGG